jgi:hypothetical protein
MFASYIIIQLASALAIFIVGFPHISFPQIFFEGTLIGLYIYFGHRLIHTFSNKNIIYHTAFHHSNPKVITSKTLELAVETVGELLSFIGVPMLFQYVFSFQLIHPLIIVFISLVYVSVHIINYSIFGSETHSRHHKDPSVNFGPDFYDHLFGTNYDSTCENMLPMYINIVVITVLLCCARHQAQLDFS